MIDVKDGYAYLDMLRAQNQRRAPDFNDLSRYLERRAREKGIPIHGQFELTPLCNLSCKMCYVHLTGNQMSGKKIMPVEQWKHLARQAFDAGMFRTTLTGGECLTYPGFDELYLYLHSLGCQVDVLTNGVLLTEERVRFFTEHPPALVQVTLYGCSEDTYERVTGQRAFEQVISGLKRIREAGLPLAVSITPNRFLGEDIFETIRLAHTLSDEVFINTSLFSPREETGRDLDDLDAGFYARILRYDQELKGIHNPSVPVETLPEPGGNCSAPAQCGLECGGGRSWFALNWKGEMQPCNRLSALAYPLRDGFQEAWRSINSFAVSYPRIAACEGCAYEAICNRCAGRLAQFAPPGKKSDAYCQETRMMVSSGVLSMPECES